MRDHQYAVTVVGTSADLTAFQEALDALPGACLLAAPGHCEAVLIFTARALDPVDALLVAAKMLRDQTVRLSDGASLSVLEHAA